MCATVLTTNRLVATIRLMKGSDMSAFYALNNFSKAVGALANKKIGRRQWLCSKYVEHLCQLELHDMPDSLRQKFIQFRIDMKAVQEACRAATLKETVLTMDEAQVGDMVARILAMNEVVVHEASEELLYSEVKSMECGKC